LPRVDTIGRFHGEVGDETVAVVDELAYLDLVSIVEIDSHAGEAFLSPVDAERPMVAVTGFLWSCSCVPGLTTKSPVLWGF